ncbi:AlbA family DNA-binding domain-containing protein [Streptomyces sp. NPDC001251]
MTRSWTRIHAHLGTPAGPLTFDMVRQAAADHLEESDDLDWKQALPAPPRDGRWNEFAKDVAAMANTRGGLLVFGVVDKTTDLVGIDPAQVNVQQYAQWVRNHVQPYLPDLSFQVLTSDNGTISVLVVDVPASEMAPHLVSGTAAKDKDERASVIPYRDHDHTAWMNEAQLERAYRDRFARRDDAEKEVQHLLNFTAEGAFVDAQQSAAWFIGVAPPLRPLPQAAPRPSRNDAAGILAKALEASRRRPDNQFPGMGPLNSLSSVADNPRPGLRRWVASTLSLRTGREVLAELHDDGTVVLALNVSWKATQEEYAGGDGLPVRQDTVRSACHDLLSITSELGKLLRVDSAHHITATLRTPGVPPSPMIPVVSQFNGAFTDVPSYATRPRRIQPATTLLPPAGTDESNSRAVQELFTDLTNQFGLSV